MEIGPKRTRLVPSSADEVVWGRDLEEPDGETMVQKGLKATTDFSCYAHCFSLVMSHLSAQ